MQRHDLQAYINEFERLKRLLPNENQTYLDMMYTFINGLEEEPRIKLMSKEEAKSYEQAKLLHVQRIWPRRIPSTPRIHATHKTGLVHTHI